MTEVDTISLPPTAVPCSGRTEPTVNEPALETTEGGRAAVTPIAVSETPSADIRLDIQPNESQPRQAEVESQEFLGPMPPKFRQHVARLIYGVPPGSYPAALKSEWLKSWGITPYRVIMSIVLVLGIPSALLSFLGNSTMASGIIGVGVALFTAILFWVKEYHNQDKNWAPWLFEKDVGELLVTSLAIIHLFIYCLPIIVTSFLLTYILGDMIPTDAMSLNIQVIVFISVWFLQIVAGSLVALTVKSDRSRLWLRKKHFVPRLLLEEVMVVTQRLIGILLCIGCARLRGISFDYIMYSLRRDLGKMFEYKGSILIAFAIMGAGWNIRSALKWAWRMGKRRLQRRI